MTLTPNIERTLWNISNQLRATLKTSECSIAVLGIVFLRYVDCNKNGFLFLPDIARFSYLIGLPKKRAIGKAINVAMFAVEEKNVELTGLLPKIYHKVEDKVLVSILKEFSAITVDICSDVLGNIYEYFLSKFAVVDGQLFGEYFTPESIAKLIVYILSPLQGKIYDPACGSGGMFIQCAKSFEKDNNRIVYGQENNLETIGLCKMNLAVHGLTGDIRHGSIYYDVPCDNIGVFDFVISNPPFNARGIDKEKLWNDKRFPYGLPKTDNGNYIWIQIFLSALNDKGRAGFVMANSASDAKYSELEIRKRLIDDGVVDVIISVAPYFFYPTVLPCTIWFFDKEKKTSGHKDTVLFIDASHIYKQIDRTHRSFSAEQIEFISNIVRLYRGEPIKTEAEGDNLTYKTFPNGKYQDVTGLCKAESLKNIREIGYSLNPSRYVGIVATTISNSEFYSTLKELNYELQHLNSKANRLGEKISSDISKMLEGKE
ncbi:MAG: N-6 DNA methylase [Nitrospirae bacterium]|nr:N-6 DNA methylase [Nitrospirota bacterium]